MSSAIVYSQASEERLRISFPFSFSSILGPQAKEQDFNFDRLKQEELEKTLNRMKENITKSLTKRMKKKKKKNTIVDTVTEVDKEVPDFTVKLYHRTNEKDLATCKNVTLVNDQLPNSDAWIEGAILEISDAKYSVVMNPPTVNKLALPKVIMAGFPVFLKIEGCFFDVDKSDFVWYVEKENKSETVESEQSVKRHKKKDSNCDQESLDWEERSVGHFYVPQNSDIGSFLRLTCTPKTDVKQGDPVTAYSCDEMQAGPGICPFERRHEHTSTHASDDSFRVVCYNILADVYADSDYSRDYLFAHCPNYALQVDYRKPLILKEITGYKSDIICLQEVDRRFFNVDLLPFMDFHGYEGSLKLKAGSSSSEGVTTFYRKGKFRMVACHDMDMTPSLENDDLFKDIKDKLASSTALQEKFMERKTVLQVNVLEACDESKRLVIVGNIHMYFHPKAQHIRMLHSLMCARHLNRVRKQYSEQGNKTPIIFCGDFNSNPWDAVVDFFLNQRIPSNHTDWFCGGVPEHIPGGMEISHEVEFESACGTPQYTNFVPAFQGCLDYIFIEKNNLRTKKIVPMPTHQEVTQYTALPNPVFPSDHIALVCDLEWIK